MSMTARPMEDQFDTSHIVGHAVSAGAIAASWVSVYVGWLPILAAFAASSVAFIWYTLQIYKDPMVQDWLHTRRQRKIAWLKIKLTELEAIKPRSTPSNSASSRTTSS